MPHRTKKSRKRRRDRRTRKSGGDRRRKGYHIKKRGGQLQRILGAAGNINNARPAHQIGVVDARPRPAATWRAHRYPAKYWRLWKKERDEALHARYKYVGEEHPDIREQRVRRKFAEKRRKRGYASGGRRTRKKRGGKNRRRIKS